MDYDDDFDEFDEFDDDFDELDNFEENLEDFQDDLDDLATVPVLESENSSNSKSDDELNHDINAWQVHITTPLSSKKIIELMDSYPSLKKITCPKSLYDRISSKYLTALEELGVSVEVNYNWGKSKYSEEDINEVVDLLKEDKSPKEVANLLNIPLTKVYYLKNKASDYFKLNNHKKKYDGETRENIKIMHQNGKKPKEIAEIKNIPLRSVYYILNHK